MPWVNGRLGFPIRTPCEAALPDSRAAPHAACVDGQPSEEMKTIWKYTRTLLGELACDVFVFLLLH